MKRLSKCVFFLLLMATLPSCSKDSNPTAPIDIKNSNTTAPIDTKESNPAAPIETEVVQGITFVSIPGGTFLMGSTTGNSDEQPVHQKTVSTFQMSATEITNTQYAVYLNTALAAGEITVTNRSWYEHFVTGAKGKNYSGQTFINLSDSTDRNNKWISYNGTSFSVVSGKENWPVEWVTWYGSKAFTLKYGFDLPSEKEWEYAARGGKQYEYGTDDGTISSANIGSLKDVGSYPANPFGLYDLAGSVWEWCNDWYGSYSKTSLNEAMVIRGSVACGTIGGRSAGRAWGAPSFSSAGLGFRVVRR